jgi:hypothetical protein
MAETMRSVLTSGARRYLDGDMTYDEFVQGLVMAIAEAPDGPEKQNDLRWLAEQITYDGVKVLR